MPLKVFPLVSLPAIFKLQVLNKFFPLNLLPRHVTCEMKNY